MAAPSQNQKGIVLNSWKEIASYLGRGVRTVQRYERDLGLPVRRPRGKSRSAVVALSDDLDTWLRQAPTRELQDESESLVVMTKPAIVTRVRSTIGEASELRTKCHELRVAHHEAMTHLVTNLKGLVEKFDGNSRAK